MTPWPVTGTTRPRSSVSGERASAGTRSPADPNRLPQLSQRLDNLHSIERRTFAEIVGDDEHRQPVVHRIIGAYATDECGVATRGVPGGGDLHDLHARSGGEQLVGALWRERPFKFGVDRQRMPGEHGHTNTGAAYPKLGNAENLARLVSKFGFFICFQRSVVQYRSAQRQRVERDDVGELA